MTLMETAGHAWCAVTWYEPFGILVPEARTPMTHTRYGHTRKVPQKATVTLHWCVVGTVSWDVRKYIACLSKLCHRKRLKWHMPPRRVFTIAGAGVERKLFWNAWDMLLHERKPLYSTRISLKALAAHMERVRNILPLAPQKWVRQIFGLSDAWTLPYDKRSTLVYCIATLKNGRKYIGQTGGRGTLRSMAKRFEEHLRSALNFRAKRHRFKTKEYGLYESMHRMGPGHFCMVPMTLETPNAVNYSEHQWIQRMGANAYNCVADSRWRSARRYRSFFVPPQPLEGKDMVSEAHRLLHMRGPPTNELLNMWLHSRVHLPKGLRLKIWERLYALVRDRHGIKLPKRLMIPHPPYARRTCPL